MCRQSKMPQLQLVAPLGQVCGGPVNPHLPGDLATWETKTIYIRKP